jgi:hypothetical protein
MKIRSIVLPVALTAALLLTLTTTASAQLFGGIVYDPTNYANAVLRYEQLRQQLTQLINTYAQIRTQYLLLLKQSQRLPFDMASRYLPDRTPWRPLASVSTYGVTTPWLTAANTGANALAAFTRATARLAGYGGALAGRSPAETARIRDLFDRTQLQDGTVAAALETIGRLRLNETTVEESLRELERDSYSNDPDLHTQVAVLDKINAAGVTAARISKDTNYLLLSLLEQQMLDATERREAVAQGLNAHAAFLTEARPLLAASTADTTRALTTFRIP